MKISVVIPTYNRRANVLQAIDSVLAQTASVDEIIVVDDGSTDGTAEAIDSRYRLSVRVLRQANSGAAAARNRGIRKATCEWIAFLDSDDVWSPTKIEKQVKALVALGSEFSACFTDCALNGGPGSEISVFERVGLRASCDFAPLENGLRYLSDTVGFATWIQSLLVRRSVLLDIGGLDETLRCEEDMDLVLRLVLRTKICLVYSPLVTVDRSPAAPRLTNRYSTRDDSRYRETSYRYRKWLAMPELTDVSFRKDIERNLRVKTYDWAIAKIYQARPALTVEKIREIRLQGDNYLKIAATLASRATRMFVRKVTNSA